MTSSRRCWPSSSGCGSAPAAAPPPGRRVIDAARRRTRHPSHDRRRLRAEPPPTAPRRAQVVDLLRAVSGTPTGQDLRASLPVVGVGGTRATDRGARRRRRDTASPRPGTLDYVTNLAGYCRSRGGHTLAFALFIDGPGNARAFALIGQMAARDRALLKRCASRVARGQSQSSWRPQSSSTGRASPLPGSGQRPLADRPRARSAARASPMSAALSRSASADRSTSLILVSPAYDGMPWLERVYQAGALWDALEMGAPADVHCYTPAEFERKRDNAAGRARGGRARARPGGA